MIGKAKSSLIPPLQLNGDKLIDDDETKAELLNTYFATQSQLEDNMSKTIPTRREETVPILQMTKISEREVLNIINKLCKCEQVSVRHGLTNLQPGPAQAHGL